MSKTIKPTELNMGSLWQDGVLFDLSVGVWAARTSLKKVFKDFHIDPTLWDEGLTGGGVVYLLDKKTRNALQRHEVRARAELMSRSFPFGPSGGRFVPVGLYDELVEKINGCKAKFEAEVKAFLAKYDDHRESFLSRWESVKLEDGTVIHPRARLEEYYPTATAVKGKFYFYWTPFVMDMPVFTGGGEEKLTKKQRDAAIKGVTQVKLNHEMAQKMKQEFESQVERFLKDEVVGTLRSQMVESFQQLKALLDSGTALSGRSLNRVIKDIDKFKQMNFVGDQGVEELIEGFRKQVLSTLDPKHVNAKKGEDNATAMALRKEISGNIDTLVKNISKSSDVDTVAGRYRRKMVID